MTDNEKPRSTSPSPLELQEVDQIKKKEEEEVWSHEPSFIEGYFKMSERDIQDSLSILHDTQALVSNYCWRATSLEETSFLEDVAALHTPGSRGKNMQATRCVLGGKSRVKAVTLFLTPLFRLNS